MGEITNGVNWLAVVTGAVLAFLLGWLWYSPLAFGKAWAKGSGVALGNPSEMPIKAMVTQLIGTFLLAWVVGVTAAQNALITIFLILAMLAVVVAGNGAFMKKSNQAIGIDAGFIIAMGAIMIVVQGIF
jgi:Protein of unknown function (DUF1761)